MGIGVAVVFKAQGSFCLNWLLEVLYLLPKILLTRTIKLSVNFAYLLKMCITAATEI